MMHKPTIRELMKKSLLEHMDSKEKSSAVTQKLLLSEDFRAARDIFIYISKEDEVDTAEIIGGSIKCGKKVYCPIISGKSMLAGKFGAMKKGKFGIPEPEKASRIKKFDLIIVPGVAFDKNGFRLGRGGGYFDRFLPSMPGKKIGLAFDFQIVNRIPKENHDVAVDSIITEKRIIRIKKNKS